MTKQAKIMKMSEKEIIKKKENFTNAICIIKYAKLRKQLINKQTK